MNSQMKDALNEFINNNTAAIEQAMNSDNQDLTKDEPIIRDLVNYLSCPTPQPSHKDNQPMSVDEKAQIQSSSFDVADLHAGSLLSSSQIQVTSDGSQFNLGSMHVSVSDTGLISDTSLSSDRLFHQHHCSYSQNSSIFPDSVQENACAGSDYPPDSSCGHQDDRVPGNEGQFYHNGHAPESQQPIDGQYQISMDSQLPSPDGHVGQFQNHTSPDELKDSSPLASSFSASANSEVCYGSSQDSLGYSMMDVTQTLQASLDASAGHFRSPENMHVDEPEVVFHQAGGKASIDCYQVAPVAVSTHYSADSFSSRPALDSAAAALSSDHGFQQLVATSGSHVADDPAAANVAHISASYEVSLNSYHQSSVSSSFSGQSFQPDPVSSQPESAISDFQSQSSLSHNPSHSLTQQPDNGFVSSSPSSQLSYSPGHSMIQQPENGFVSSSPSSQLSYSPGHGVSQQQENGFVSSSPGSQLSYSPGQPSPYHSTSSSHQQTNIHEGFQMTGSSCPSTSLTFGQEQQLCKSLQPQPFHQSSPLDHSSFQPSPAHYHKDVHTPDQHSTGYNNSIESPAGSSASFSSPDPTGGLSHQQNYLGTGHPAMQSNESSDHGSYSSGENAILAADLAAENHPQVAANYEAAGPPGQITDTGKLSSDVTMREFTTGMNLTSYSQIDLETVVTNFGVESNASTVQQISSEQNTSSVILTCGIDYSNMTTDSASFSTAPHTVADVNAPLSFDQHNSAVPGPDSYMPTISETFVSGPCNQSSGSEYRAPEFGLNPSQQVSNENYPQPMQVQDSDFSHKTAEDRTSFSYVPSAGENLVNNTETAMDVSSSLGEKNESLTSSISYEEIHMSIVKAGNALSKARSDINSIDPLLYFGTTNVEAASVETSVGYSSLYSKPVTEIFKTETPLTSSEASYDLTPQVPAVMSKTIAPDLVSHQGSVNSDLGTYITASSASAPNCLSSINEGLNFMSDMLKNVQELPAAPNHAMLQEQISWQANGTVPNFLENPGVVSSNSDIVIPPAEAVSSQQQTLFVVTMVTDPPPTDLRMNSIVNKPALPSGSNDGCIQGQVLNTAGPSSSQLFSPAINAAQASNQLGSDLLDQVCTAGSLPNSKIVPAQSHHVNGVPADLASSSGFFLQLTPAQGANKISALTHPLSGALKPSVTTHQTPKSNCQGVAPGSAPVRNPPPNITSNQPHIIVSLEDLQKLLAQQNLSHPAPSPFQHNHSTSSSPQNLVLQKHASHSLRQSQPRPLIRGSTLSTTSRLVHPQQQLQQTREKLQLLTNTSEQTATLTHRNLEQSINSSSQEHQQKLLSSFQFASFSQQDQRQMQHKLQLLQPSQPAEVQPKMQLQLKQIQQQPQQMVNLFLQQVPQTGQLKHAPAHHQTLQCSTEEKLADVEGHIHPPEHHQRECLDKSERVDRPCSDSLKKDYKHLHSLLTGETISGTASGANLQTKVLPSVLSLPSSSLQGQPFSLQLLSGSSGNATNICRTQPAVTQAPFSFMPTNSFSSLHLSNSAQHNAPLTTLAFVKSFSTATFSKTFISKDLKAEVSSSSSQQPHNPVKSEDSILDKKEPDNIGDSSSAKQASLLAQMLTERKRCHTPLSVDVDSPANSESETTSPLSSPIPIEDGNTQLTLIERSAELRIKSDTMHSVENDDDENASFDLNAFHKRPSAGELYSAKRESVPVKIAKPSLHADARSAGNPASSQEPTFDFGSALSSASNFSFAFGNKEETSEVFTFGSNSTAAPASDTIQCKDGSKHYRPSSSKSTAKPAGIRATVPTQHVRPTARKQKEFSLKAYYSSKLDSMELKIVEQPEVQHRARYQTEGSRGAIKDVSQQGYPVVKLIGYNKATKLQVFIGDECGRVKPHGFYQACRVFGKNSTACVEQEIDGTTVIEMDMLPENDLTVRLDCIGILKLRNADVERRIGPKRARDKKRTNTKARLVMRCVVDKPDGSQHILQAVSHPIVCTQPVGQPEISRMSLTESSVKGGDSLFIIGKNFKNKGTSVFFQALDSSEENVVWQAEAEIEQEFFQPTHLICKIPPYKDCGIEKPLVVQIVISSAGKKSDSHNFTYKPVYPVAVPVKLETPMETDSSMSSRPLPFVSPEALHLNRMVQQTHAQSSTSASMFQLPPGTIPSIQGLQSPPETVPAMQSLHSLPGTIPSIQSQQSPQMTIPSIQNLQSPPVTIPSIQSLHSLSGTIPSVQSVQESPPVAISATQSVQQSPPVAISATQSMLNSPPENMPSTQSTVAALPRLIKASTLANHISSHSDVAVVPPMPALTASPAATALPAPFCSNLPSVPSEQALPSFLMEVKADGPDLEPLNEHSQTDLPTSALGNGVNVNCIVHSNSKTNPIPPMSYAVSAGCSQPSLTPSSSTGRSLCADTPPPAAIPFPCKPFFVVVDPSMLQTSLGVERLLQQIMEAHSKA